MIYASTYCLKGGDLFNLLKACEDKGLTNIELGPSVNPGFDMNRLIGLKDNFQFLVHAYFPPPKESFVVNLASKNPKILEASINQVKIMLDFCNDMGINLMSIHPGFACSIDPEHLGHKIICKGLINYDEAFDIFVSSINEILDYAKGIKIAVENNVVAPFNLIDGKNKIFMLSEANEFKLLFSKINNRNFGMLLDVGHLKVSSKTLNFNGKDFVRELKGHIFEIHLHDNNCLSDTHEAVKKDSWPLSIINKVISEDIPLVIESRFEGIGKLVSNIKLVSDVLGIKYNS